MNLENFSQDNQQTLILYILKPDGTSVQDSFILPPTAVNGAPNEIEFTPAPPIEPAQNTSSEAPYECSKCYLTFKKQAAYRKHLVWHSTVKKYNCDKCTAGFNNENNFQIHQALHEQGKPTCPICNVSCQRSASLKSHLLIHQVEELFTCDECSSEFEKEQDLTKHLQSHAKPPKDSNSLVCSYCKVEFEHHSAYKDHVSKHIKVKKLVLGKKTRRTHGKKSNAHACEICNKSFSKLSLLERHLRVHSGERPFVCNHCNKGFSQKGTLEIHLYKHKGMKPFECTLCEAKFRQKGHLRAHVDKTHTVTTADSKNFKCGQCACIFKTVASLNVHVTKSHTTKNASDISTVMNQLRELHEQNKPDESISYVKLTESLSDGTLRRYLVQQKTVNETKWYICNDCTKSFKKPSDLIRHIRVHTGEKPYVCKRCGAAFALKSTLYTHVETHIDTKSFVCPVCLKKFPSARTVNSHLRLYSIRKNKRYNCTICKGSFPTWREFHIHAHKVHSKIKLKAPLIQTANGFEPVSPKETKKERKYSCSKCNATFSTMRGLNKHKLIHNPEQRLKCDQCPRTYNAMSALKEHKMLHLGLKNYQCQQCEKRYATTSLLKRHAISHTDEKPYKCPYCKKIFKTLPICKQHIETHKKDVQIVEEDKVQEPIDPPLNITIVNDKKEQDIQQQPVIFLNYGEDCFQLSDNLLFNTLEFQDTNVYNIENDNFSNEEIFVNPNETTNKNKNEELTVLFNLDQDFTNIPDVTNLDIPVASNSQEVPEDQTTVEIEQFPCLECEEMFDSKALLNKHQVSSHGAKNHSCTHCNKPFKKHSDLVRHLRTHTGEKPFSCELCDKSFSLKSTLMSHLKTHNPISHKSHNCTVCNSFFTSKSSLKVHMNSHTGLKPHKCSFCELKFRTVAHKKSHETSHGPKNTKKPGKTTTLLESVAMDVTNDTVQPTLENVLIVQDSLQLSGEHEPLVLHQLQPNFIVPDEFLPLIQLDDGNLLNVKSAEENPPQTCVEKPRDLECDICHKKYASKDVLRKHKKIHGVNKPFPCTKCDKGFNTLDDLLVHDKIHDGSRPFACDYCSNSFTKKHSLTTHLKRIHQITFQEF